MESRKDLINFLVEELGPFRNRSFKFNPGTFHFLNAQKLKQLVNLLDEDNPKLFGTRPECPGRIENALEFRKEMRRYTEFPSQGLTTSPVYEAIANYLEYKIKNNSKVTQNS